MTTLAPPAAQTSETRGRVETRLEPVQRRGGARNYGYLVTIISHDPYQHDVGEPRWFLTLPEAMEYESKVLDLIG